MASTSVSKTESQGSNPCSPTTLIFGSTALRHWFPDFPRDPQDLDYICKDKPGKSKGIEYHWEDGFQYILDNNVDPKYVDPAFLYTIKVAHAAWDVFWLKTIHDVQFLKHKGCVLDEMLYSLLIKDNIKRHGAKRVSVKGTPEEFFKTYISRTVPHDELHHLVKFYDEPLHNRIRANPNDVKTSRFLWDNLSHEDKIKCALEETYVFALERFIHMPPKIAVANALRNLITSSTKGYFNLFLIENFSELMYYDLARFKEIYKSFRSK